MSFRYYTVIDNEFMVWEAGDLSGAPLLPWNAFFRSPLTDWQVAQFFRQPEAMVYVPPEILATFGS